MIKLCIIQTAIYTTDSYKVNHTSFDLNLSEKNLNQFDQLKRIAIIEISRKNKARDDNCWKCSNYFELDERSVK